MQTPTPMTLARTTALVFAGAALTLCATGCSKQAQAENENQHPAGCEHTQVAAPVKDACAESCQHAAKTTTAPAVAKDSCQAGCEHAATAKPKE